MIVAVVLGPILSFAGIALVGLHGGGVELVHGRAFGLLHASSLRSSSLASTGIWPITPMMSCELSRKPMPRPPKPSWYRERSRDQFLVMKHWRGLWTLTMLSKAASGVFTCICAR